METLLAQTVRNPLAGFGVVLIAVVVIAIVGGLWAANRNR